MSVVAEHLVLGARVLDPPLTALEVHRAELPAPHRVVHARLEPPLLLLVAHREPVLDEHDPRCARACARSPTGRMNSSYSASVQKPMTRSTPARLYHDRSNRTISPAAAVRDVPLEVPLRLLALGRARERDHAERSRSRALRDPLDHATLARGVRAPRRSRRPQPSCLTHSWSSTSSTCSRAISRSKAALMSLRPEGAVHGLRRACVGRRGLLAHRAASRRVAVYEGAVIRESCRGLLRSNLGQGQPPRKPRPRTDPRHPTDIARNPGGM